MASVAVFGDTSPPHQAMIARAVSDAGHERVVFLGDAVDEHGTLKRRRRMARWVRDLAPLRGRLLAIGGNHDFDDDGGSSAYSSALAGLDCADGRSMRFSSAESGLHVVGLTIPRGAHAVTADDLTWCERAFASGDPGDVRVVAVHEPLFPIAARIGLSLDAVPSSRDAFLAYLEHWGVAVVLSGHEHLYARRALGSQLVQITSGGGGASGELTIFGQCDAARIAPHYVSLRRSGSGLVVTAHSLDSGDIDRHVVGVAR